MLLQKVHITQLFGQVDHRLTLNTDTGLTVFTAPNGYGKTLLLSLIKAFYCGDFPYLLSVKFHKLEFIFSDQSISFTQLDRQHLSISLNDNNQPKATNTSIFDLNDFSEGFSAPELDQIVHNIALTADSHMDVWGNDEYSHQCHTATVNQHPEMIHWNKQLYTQDIQALLKDRKVVLIPAQRLNLQTIIKADLFSCTEENDTSAIAKCGLELAQDFAAHQENYQQICKALDSTFANRLLSNTTEIVPLKTEILCKQYKGLLSTREQLSAYGLLEAQNPPLPPVDELSLGNERFLAIFVQDLRDKLNLYQNLLQRLSLFTEMVNDNLNFKSLVINPEKGFEVLADNKQAIVLEHLSIGEQQWIVLLYHLIFGIEFNSTILIDEPEAGLSNQWQRALVKNIKTLMKLFNAKVIMATQSAQLVEHQDQLVIKRCANCGHLH